MSLCGRYMGDNDGTCPQLTCVRASGHDGLCDNVRGDDDRPGPQWVEGRPMYYAPGMPKGDTRQRRSRRFRRWRRKALTMFRGTIRVWMGSWP